MPFTPSPMASLPSEGPMRDSFEGLMAQAARRLEHQLELLGLLELLVRIARAHGDAGAPAGDLGVDDRRGVDHVVEDDGEAALHVGPGDLLEPVGARRVEAQGHGVRAPALARIGRRDAGVGDVVAGDLRAAEQVERAPTHVGGLAGVGVVILDGKEANLMIVWRVQGGCPLLETIAALGHRLVFVLGHRAKWVGTVFPGPAGAFSV